MPAVPALIAAGGSLGAGYMGMRAANSTARTMGQRSPEELALMRQQTSFSKGMQRQGQELFATAMPGVRQTLDYYGTLLSGNRGAQMAAVAPEAESIADVYKGADRDVASRLVGGERDQALAESKRAKAGQISRLISGVRPGAAAATGGMAAGLLGPAGSMMQGGAAASAGLLENMTGNRLIANQMGQEAGANTARNIGQLIARLMGSFSGGGGRAPIPGRTTVPPMTVGYPGNQGGPQISY